MANTDGANRFSLYSNVEPFKCLEFHIRKLFKVHETMKRNDFKCVYFYKTVIKTVNIITYTPKQKTHSNYLAKIIRTKEEMLTFEKTWQKKYINI